MDTDRGKSANKCVSYLALCTRHCRSGDFACVKRSHFLNSQHHPLISIKTLHEAIIFSHQAHKASELICFHICLLYTSLHDPRVPKITIDIFNSKFQVITFDLVVSRFGSVQLFSNCERNHGPSSTLMSNSGLDHTRFKFERVPYVSR